MPKAILKGRATRNDRVGNGELRSMRPFGLAGGMLLRLVKEERMTRAMKAGEKERATGYLVLQIGSKDVGIPLYGEWPKEIKEWLDSEDEWYCPNPFDI